MICAKILKKLRSLHPLFPISSHVHSLMWFMLHELLYLDGSRPTLISNPRVERSNEGGLPCRRWGWETTKGRMNVYPSHSGTFMQVQETYVKVATRLFNSRRTNVTPCLLLETKALYEILNLWGGREGRKACTHLFFSSFLNGRRQSPLGFGDPIWAVFIWWLILLCQVLPFPFAIIL